MAFAKVRNAIKGLVLLSECFSRLGLKLEIWGFQDIPFQIKAHDVKMDDTVRDRLMGMLLEPEGRNPGGNNEANYNSDGYALSEVSKRLEEIKSKHNFLVVLSDGEPAPDLDHIGLEYELPYVIEEIKRNTDQKLVGGGIGPGTEHVEDYYPNSLVVEDMKEFVQKMADLFEDMIKNPQKYQ